MQRLFEQFIPTHYDLSWDLSAIKNKRAATATAIIQGEQRDSGAIRLHAKDLTIDHVLVDEQQVTYSVADDELTIAHEGAGRVTIKIDYHLTITDAMHGIYPCYYTLDGEKHELYATQFESHHAREAFPCIDEPEAKATFDITLISDEPVVLSNMPIALTKDIDGHRATTFQTTPRMSSYLVAFVVGDLQRATMTTKHNVEVNVYATKAQPAASLTWALEHAANTIDFFDDYFEVPYPLPKSDHVALPDFSSGAMENWGLVTYREIALLANPATSSLESREYVAQVVAHELSHQWFGDLVTMKWWNNLWLNESFATVMENVAPDAMHPDWNVWFDFITGDGVVALRRDAIDGVQSVQVDVSHPDEIGALFDGAIVYAKGGRLLRMMQVWIGDEAFRQGLKTYFEKFQYHNTTGDDLWRCLAEASGKDVVGLMNTWITQPGYPVVRATLDGDQLKLSQEQFFVGPHEPSTRQWPIPLEANSSLIPDVMDGQSLSLTFSSDDILLLNSTGNGHFVTLYDETLRGRILAALRDDKLNAAQRAVYLNEQTLLARGGYISSATLVELVSSFRHESNDKVWDMVAIAISELKKFVTPDTPDEMNLRKLVGAVAREQFNRLSWDKLSDESEADTKLRPLILGLMLYSEDQAIINEALRRYHEKAPDRLDPELRALLMSAAVRHDPKSSEIVEQLLGLYRETSSADLQSDITASVTSTRDTVTIDRLITLLTDKETIRPQDLIRWYANLLRNHEGRSEAWKWMREKWDWIEESFASDKSHDYFPRYSASLLDTREQLQEFKDFFTPLRADQSLVRAIDMGILDLEARVDLIERDKQAVVEALQRI